MIVSFGDADLELEAAEPAGISVPCVLFAHPHPRMRGTMDNKACESFSTAG